MNKNTKHLVITALMTAFTCIATMIIKFPTPTFGYIHPGDGLVLLCGILLGPVTGALAAGIGSMLSDIFSGYLAWAPATLIIKALTAAIAGYIFHHLRSKQTETSTQTKSSDTPKIILGGIFGELIMVLGYFLYEAGLAAFATGSFNQVSLAAGITSSASGIPFNIVQGIVGIVIAVAILPILKKIPTLSDYLAEN